MAKNKSLEEQIEENNKYWEERIAKGTWDTYNSLEDKNRALLEFYIDASKAVKEELYTLAEKYSKNGVLSLSEMYKQNRLTELNKKYEKIAEQLGHQVQETSEKNMQEGFQEVYKNTALGLDNIHKDFAMPNKKLMEKLLNEPWRGDSFSGRLWKNQKELAVGLKDILLTGMQQGKTTTEIAVKLNDFVGENLNKCHRLVRTETMHYLNNATLRRYQDADVQYVRIWAAVDERTCDTCGVGGYHDKVYPIEKAPILPLHPNCRCTYLPAEEEYFAQNKNNIFTSESKNDIIEPKDKTNAKSQAIYTQQELLQKSKEVNQYLNSIGLPNSKWSGKTFIKSKTELPKARGVKKATCDIWLREDAGEKTIIHEHLHARSSSWMPKRLKKERGFEEGACELLAEEICKQNNISYKATYVEYVEPLRKFREVHGEYGSDYEFALDLFEVDMDKREQWLIDLADEKGTIKSLQLKHLIRKVRKGNGK